VPPGAAWLCVSDVKKKQNELIKLNTTDHGEKKGD